MKAEQEQTSRPVPSPESLAESAWFDREVSWLRAGASQARWIAFAVLTALVLDLIVVATFSTGPINVFHNDALLLLDDGWRVLNGQVPHRDFNSPLGPFEFWIVATGMLLSHSNAQGIAIGISAFGLALGVWTWLLCRKRMPILFALLLTAWIVFTATCPTPLGFDPRYLSCAMVYNRQGYALLGIILIECAFARETSRFMGGFSSGIAFVILVFLKLNFFGVAALLLLVTIPITRVELARAWGFLAGTAGCLLAILLYPRFSFAAFFSDMSFVAHARGSSLNAASLLQGIITCAKSGSVWLVLGMTVAVLILTAPSQRSRSGMMALALFSLIVLASGPLFLATNSLENRCQLASLWMILLLDRLSTLHLRLKEYKVATLALIAACLGWIAAALVPEVSSTLTLLGYQSAAQKSAGLRIDAPGMENLRFYDSTVFYDKVKAGDGDGTYYVHCLDDGLALLKSQSKPDESILALGFHNPFSYLLRRKPAEGGSSYLFMNNSISETAMPPVNWVFGNADLMILPAYEGTHRDSDQYIQDHYRAYLLQNFHFVAKSQYWSLYRRNQ